jgi:hypothetical protein
MTETAFEDLPLHRGGRSRPACPPLVLRMRVFLARWSLDRQIAAGCPYGWSATVSLRASQLSSREARRDVALRLRGVVADADRGGSPRARFSEVILHRAVRADRELILGLAERLEAGGPASARSVALAQALLTDGVESPLFNRHCGVTVAEAVWAVADALADDVPASGSNA